MALLQAPTVDELVTEVRSMINQPDPDNSFVSNEELIRWINEGIRRYFAEVVTNSEGQFTTTADLNIVSGSDLVALPTDSFRVKTLWRLVSNGYISLAYIQGAQNASYSTLGDTGGDGYVPSFYLRGNNIVLRPAPAFSQTGGLRVEYVQIPDYLVDSGDSVSSQISPVFRDLLIAYGVYKAKLKESGGNIDLTQSFRTNLNDLFQAFKDSITPRADFPQYVSPYNPELD